MVKYQNISLCQINVKQGQSEYYLPMNANWREKKVEKIVVYAHDVNIGVKSPIDNQGTLDRVGVENLYFDLYNTAGENVIHNIHAWDLLDLNNYPIEIGQQLSFDLSRLFFTQAPATDGALMLYIFYNETEASPEEATENVTVEFDVPSQTQVSFLYVIEHYLYAASKGVRAITVWNDKAVYYYNSGFITLRDTTGKLAHEQLPTYFFRPVGYPVSGEPILRNHIPLDCVELDFNNSFMYNPHAATIHYIVTFYY